MNERVSICAANVHLLTDADIALVSHGQACVRLIVLEFPKPMSILVFAVCVPSFTI